MDKEMKTIAPKIKIMKKYEKIPIHVDKDLYILKVIFGKNGIFSVFKKIKKSGEFNKIFEKELPNERERKDEQS